MGAGHVVLVVACFLLIVTHAFAASPSRIKLSLPTEHEDVNGNRLLRVAGTDSSDAEDRGLISSVKSITSNIKTSTKTSYWAKVGRTNAQVREKLGLVGLTGKALAEHPNYGAYSSFLYKQEGEKLNRWLSDNKQTEDVWKSLRLDQMTAKQREVSDALRIYKRYALKFDNKVDHNLDSLFERAVSVGKNSDDEMAVKIRLWVDKGRTPYFVRRVLGLPRKNYENDKYFKAFMIASGRLKQGF
ncbi:putative secreted RxLR effector protein [Phytophthora cinnamomi]|uniref:putative secreted RxLR effector protein n=1 Tax=Phytophthora cinnamomi TaxID=4785 RepID=UPI002A332DD6|nr:putative secreted RxLR effector protein [Phytophthora cinnamomi]KAJ8575515.1 hypothetical protein ON010_g3701 [Phytophthora cinnamomi]